MLRQGTLHNPKAFDLRFELGRVTLRWTPHTGRAREILSQAGDLIREGEEAAWARRRLWPLLAEAAEKEGDLHAALDYLERWQAAAPHSNNIRERILAIRRELGQDAPPKAAP